ncbi:MAG TPA: MraY family glycosyltransferase, partial [Polyangiaceae bacterium]|nr:MraY family glycosyltransferase [Polyangiaceae bacterium]
GDSGSYFLGYLLATTSLTGAMQKTSTAVSLLVPMVALGVPIFDTLFSMLRRTLERRSMFSPDRGHVHHRLIDMGLTHRRAVMLLYGVSILMMVSAIAIALGRSWESGVALLVASVVLTGLIRFVGYFEYVRLRRAAMLRQHDARTRALRRLVPAFTADVAALGSEEQLWARLVELAAAAGCAVMYLEGLQPRDGTAAAGERHWPADPASEEAGGLIYARFTLAPSGSLEFGFRSGEEMSAQADILLQLVADAVEAALRRHALAGEAASARAGLAPGSSARTDPRSLLATR